MLGSQPHPALAQGPGSVTSKGTGAAGLRVIQALAAGCAMAHAVPGVLFIAGGLLGLRGPQQVALPACSPCSVARPPFASERDTEETAHLTVSASPFLLSSTGCPASPDETPVNPICCQLRGDTGIWVGCFPFPARGVPHKNTLASPTPRHTPAPFHFSPVYPSHDYRQPPLFRVSDAIGVRRDAGECKKLEFASFLGLEQ